ncbi:MAG: DUF1667 domain-containing protein [Candidatus Hydrogenedentes bacterium]|nr:DUF1667 domain-containing protein [Candidatus Hydrogenedentota bacterium]
MEKEIICLGCPNGCHLCVTQRDRNDIEVLGNQCDKGIVYGREEFLEPKRVVTAVVRTGSDTVPFVPVKTDKPLVIAMIPKLLEELRRQEARLPVRAGDVLIDDFSSTGVRVCFTRTSDG